MLLVLMQMEETTYVLADTTRRIANVLIHLSHKIFE